MPLPSPPYTYNDPRLIYNEHCFKYNGGYDDVCLNPPAAVVVPRRGGKSTVYPKPHHSLDVLISVELSGVNQISIEDTPKYTRYRDVFDKDPAVQIFNIKTKANENVSIHVTSFDVSTTSPSFSVGKKMVETKHSLTGAVLASLFTESLNRKTSFSVDASIITSGSFDR